MEKQWKNAFCSSLRDENGSDKAHHTYPPEIPRATPPWDCVCLSHPTTRPVAGRHASHAVVRSPRLPWRWPWSFVTSFPMRTNYRTNPWMNKWYNKNDRNIVKLYEKNTWILEIQHLGCFPSAGLHEPPDEKKTRKETNKETKKQKNKETTKIMQTIKTVPCGKCPNQHFPRV